jgi:hypothetical protein
MTEVKPWCKIVIHPVYGQVLVQAKYDGEQDKFLLSVSWKGRRGHTTAEMSRDSDADAGEAWAHEQLEKFSADTAKDYIYDWT